MSAVVADTSFFPSRRNHEASAELSNQIASQLFRFASGRTQGHFTLSDAQAFWTNKTLGTAVPTAVVRSSGRENDLVRERHLNAQEIQTLATEWQTHLLDSGAAITTAALTETATPVFKALAQFGPGAVDLTGLKADKVSGMHLAVILRATLSRKSRTPGWDEALETARAALLRDGIPESDALQGLISDPQR